MWRIALAGDLYTGKTTLAQTLEQRGWHLLDHTGLLKELGSIALTAAGFPVTVADIVANKDHYRLFLQELGTAVGWDEGAGIRRLLARWEAQGAPEPVVLESVRTAAQWRILAKAGFGLVRLRIPLTIQEQRAGQRGVTPTRLQAVNQHLAESQIPTAKNEIVLSTQNNAGECWLPTELASSLENICRIREAEIR